jgi:hypothetical protein
VASKPAPAQEKYTKKEQTFIAMDNLRAMLRCYMNSVRGNALVPPGIGNGLCDYEERIKTEFQKLADLLGMDITQLRF